MSLLCWGVRAQRLTVVVVAVTEVEVKWMMRGAVIGRSAVSIVDSMGICMLFSVILCYSMLFDYSVSILDL